MGHASGAATRNDVANRESRRTKVTDDRIGRPTIVALWLSHVRVWSPVRAQPCDLCAAITERPNQLMEQFLDDLVEILTHPLDDLFNALLLIVLIAPLADLLYFHFGPDNAFDIIAFIAQLIALVVLFANLPDRRHNVEAARANVFYASIVLVIAAVIWIWIRLDANDVSQFGGEASWVFLFVSLTLFLGVIAMMRKKRW